MKTPSIEEQMLELVDTQIDVWKAYKKRLLERCADKEKDFEMTIDEQREKQFYQEKLGGE